MTRPQMIRVLLVDDHAVVRGGLSFFLSTTDDIEVVGEAADGEQALRLCAELHPDVVVMDMLMPQMDGFTAMQQIRQRYPNIRVIALTSFLEGELVQRALQAGASGYLLKDVQARELADAIRAAYAGRSTMSQDATQALMQTMARPAQVGEELSEREREVLVRIARGLSNGEIGAQLTISTNTVRHHVRNILAKLEVTNRTEAVHVAMQRGLVE
jgi:two-component system, NarL family, response regulator LiaR